MSKISDWLEPLKGLDAFNLIALAVLAGMVLFLGRGGCGATLGIDFGPGGYVEGVNADISAQGSQREVIEFNDRKDRVISIAGRPVNSVAEIGAVLRSLDPALVPEAIVEPEPDPFNAPSGEQGEAEAEEGDQGAPPVEGEAGDQGAPPVEGEADSVGLSLALGAEGAARMVPPSVVVILERYDYRFVEVLNSQMVADRGFPSTIDEGDRVVGLDGREVSGGVDLTFVSEELARRPTESITFMFERPVHKYHVSLPLTEPPLRLWPCVLFAVALAVVIVLGWRARGEPVGEPGRGIWLPLALASLTVPWALMLLGDPVLTLRDPLLLFLGLTALAFFRPLVLETHRRLRGGAPSVTTAGLIFLPALVVAFLGLFLVLSVLPSVWGGPVSGEKEYQIAGIIQVSVGMMAVYHLLDLVLWFRRRPDKAEMTYARWPQLGLLIASLALVTSLLHLGYDAQAFVVGAFVLHAAGLVLVLWLGDLALMATPPEDRPVDSPGVIFPEAARDDLLAFFRDVTMVIHPDDPVVVVARDKAVWKIEIDALGEEPALLIRRGDETLRSGVGLFRDEGVPLPIHHPAHEDEPTGGEEVVQGVASSLGITAAFSLYDEANQIEGLDHQGRERVFFAFFIVERGSTLIQAHEMAAIRERFEGTWPNVRQLVINALLEEASASPPLPSSAAAIPAAAPVPPAQPPAPRAALELFEDPEDAPPQTSTRAQGEGDAATDDLDNGAYPALDAAVAQPVKVEIREVVREVVVSSPELPYLRRDLAERHPVEEPGLMELMLERQIDGLADGDAPVIVIGPTGIGKEFVARRIHAISRESSGPFIKFNVSTCPPSLRALELLGEGPGEGHLGAARGGVLFVEDAAELDEAPLTRLLAEAGGESASARLVLSIRTHPNQSAEQAIKSLGGSLGQLARGVFSQRVIALNALHERPQIVRSIVDHYLHGWAMKHNKVITDVSVDAIEILMKRRWPGGVAELRACLEAAVLRCDGDTLEARHLALTTSSAIDKAPVSGDAMQLWIKTAPDLREALWQLQELVYLEALEREEGNKSAAARLVGVKRTTFVSRLKERGQFEE